MSKLTTKQKGDIVQAYTVGLVPAAELASLAGVTRQSIYKVLWKEGVNTSKQGGIPVSCSACGEVIRRHRSRVRKNKHNFCDQECHGAFIQAGGYVFTGKVRRQGSRLARAAVAKVFDLQEGHVVHHINGNVLDNDLRNLMVLQTSGDHARIHRGFEVQPLWSGAEL